MSDVTQPYLVGQPCWYDMTVTDLDAAKDFYAALFGWQFEPSPWKYEKASRRGRAVAALSAGQPEGQSNWTVYLATDDIEATTRAVAEAGGTVVREPHDAPTGRLAVVADPAGAVCGVWEGKSFHGSEAVNEAGAPCWAEVSSADPPAAADFYAAVFGVEVRRPFPGFDYSQLVLDGKEVAGILGHVPEGRPAKGHAAWLVYFQVDDTDEAARTAAERGGAVIEQPCDTPFGRLAIIADPVGARCAVITRPPGEQG
jgi:predicted enzyme related to lactoylglutathione lyase